MVQTAAIVEMRTRRIKLNGAEPRQPPQCYSLSTTPNGQRKPEGPTTSRRGHLKSLFLFLHPTSVTCLRCLRFILAGKLRCLATASGPPASGACAGARARALQRTDGRARAGGAAEEFIGAADDAKTRRRVCASDGRGVRGPSLPRGVAWAGKGACAYALRTFLRRCVCVRV